MTESVWLSQYPVGVSHEIPQDETTLVECLLAACERYPDNVAFVNFGRSLRYAELAEQGRAFAAYLRQHLHLSSGDRVAIMLPNILQYPVALLGVLMAGLVVVNVNPLFTARELRGQLQDSGARALVVLDHFAHVAEQAIADTFVTRVIVTRVGDMLSRCQCWLMQAAFKLRGKITAYHLPNGMQWLESLRIGRSYTPMQYAVKSDDIAFLQYTGGTTGAPKGAILTHRNIVCNMRQVLTWVHTALDEGAASERILTALPLYHIFSLTANLLIFWSRGACNILITNPRDISGLLRAMARYRPHVFTGVNTLFNALVNHPSFSSVDFQQLRFTVGGGMAVQKAVADGWHRVTGKPIIEAYGLTETSPAVAANLLDINAYTGTVGLPLPSTQVRILDDSGFPVPYGVPGELCIKGPQVMAGYWQRPQETAHVFHADGWFKTGDIAIMDKDGFIRIVDRKKDMILVSGFNVYPNEIESVLGGHPDILEVAAIGVPDMKSGEAVKLFVVRKTPGLTEQTVREFCRANFTGYKRPKYIEFCEELPKSNVGKVLRRELREAELRKL